MNLFTLLFLLALGHSVTFADHQSIEKVIKVESPNKGTSNTIKYKETHENHIFSKSATSAIKTFKTKDGDVIDCVKFEEQSTLKNPKFENYRNQKNPPNDTDKAFKSSDSTDGTLKQTWGLCPQGTVPQMRKSQKVQKLLTDQNNLALAHQLENVKHDIRLNKSKSGLATSKSSNPSATSRYERAGYSDFIPNYGISADLEVYMPYIETNQESSSATIRVGSNNYDTIEAGWSVDPWLYPDSYTPRLTSFWGNSQTGKYCFNTNCDGFVQYSTSVLMGSPLSPGGKLYTISLQIVKGDGAWWLKFFDEWVGYWPNNLFAELNTGPATYMRWAGNVFNTFNQGLYTATDMGSGYRPTNTTYAAAISKLSYLNASLFSYNTNPGYFILSDGLCYDISNIYRASDSSYYFYYGGGGYSSQCTGLGSLPTTSPSPPPPPPPSPPPPSPPPSLPPPSPPPPPRRSPPPPPRRSPPPPRRSPSPPPPLQEDRETWLSPTNLVMTKRNKYFRFSSYKFIGEADDPNWELVAKVDWTRTMTPIVDQSDCNACWAIAPAASVESLLYIANAGGKSVSVQQILDCQGQNKSCGGGWPTDAYEYIATNGVARDIDYPSPKQLLNQRCRTTNNIIFKNIKISMYEEVDFYGSFGLMLAVQNQPVVVNIQSSERVFRDYKKGVLNDEKCFTNIVDHSVVVVGYNLFQGGTPHWIIRNSWGVGWGIKGYMQLAYTGGVGICGIHSTPAIYPVLNFKVMSGNSNSEENPCGSPNPCGGGICAIDPKNNNLNSCTNCPNSYVVVTNLDGTQSCASQYVCGRKFYNPCGSGTCVDDMLGSYSCICAPGFVQNVFADRDDYTCVEASTVTNTANLFYTVQKGDSCQQIYNNFLLSKTQFLKQNKVDCNKLTPGLKLNVSQSKNWAGCAVRYTWSYGDTCTNVARFLGILRSVLLSLNPDLDCTDVPVGRQICVRSGQPPVRIPPCANQYSVGPEDTCSSIIQAFQLNVFWFLLYNPGIDCQTLSPRAIGTSSNSLPIAGQTVCVDAAEPFGKAVSFGKCSLKYVVIRGDTLAALVIKYFQRNYNNFKKLNGGVFIPKVGQMICRQK